MQGDLQLICTRGKTPESLQVVHPLDQPTKPLRVYQMSLTRNGLGLPTNLTPYKLACLDTWQYTLTSVQIDCLDSWIPLIKSTKSACLDSWITLDRCTNSPFGQISNSPKSKKKTSIPFGLFFFSLSGHCTSKQCYVYLSVPLQHSMIISLLQDIFVSEVEPHLT